jgi:hypothetical protein
VIDCEFLTACKILQEAMSLNGAAFHIVQGEIDKNPVIPALPVSTTMTNQDLQYLCGVLSFLLTWSSPSVFVVNNNITESDVCVKSKLLIA